MLNVVSFCLAAVLFWKTVFGTCGQCTVAFEDCTKSKENFTYVCNCSESGAGVQSKEQICKATWKDLGCWKDNWVRAISELNPNLNWVNRKYAIAKCASYAMKQGYTVFAVENRGECFTSENAHNTYKKYGPSTDCNSDGMGGWWAFRVYRIDVKPKKETENACPAPARWTNWYNRDAPSGKGDYEVLTNIREENPGQICEHPIGVEGQLLDGRPWQSGGDTVSISQTNGLVCLNAEQSDGRCNNYKVRFCCPSVDEVQTVPSCPGNWTRFYDRDDPSGNADYEHLGEIRRENPGQVCAEPVAIDVRLLNGDDWSKGGNYIIPEQNTPTFGFSCDNRQQGPHGKPGCKDYKIRFCCLPDPFNKLFKCSASSISILWKRSPSALSGFRYLLMTQSPSTNITNSTSVEIVFTENPKIEVIELRSNPEVCVTRTNFRINEKLQVTVELTAGWVHGEKGLATLASVLHNHSSKPFRLTFFD